MNIQKYTSYFIFCLVIALTSCGDGKNGDDNSDSARPGENNAYNNDEQKGNHANTPAEQPGTAYPGSRVDSAKQTNDKLAPSQLK